MLILSVQFGGERFHPGHVDLLEPVGLIVFVVAFGVVVLPLFRALAKYARLRMRAGRAHRRGTHVVATAEPRARALMGELCPHGWRAQITLVGSDGAQVLDLPGGGGPLIALDWAALEADGRRTAVVRRVWGATIAEALDAMVADRRTDETLEQIEQRAFADGAPWPDL